VSSHTLSEARRCQITGISRSTKRTRYVQVWAFAIIRFCLEAVLKNTGLRGGAFYAVAGGKCDCPRERQNFTVVEDRYPDCTTTHVPGHVSHENNLSSLWRQTAVTTDVRLTSRQNCSFAVHVFAIRFFCEQKLRNWPWAWPLENFRYQIKSHKSVWRDRFGAGVPRYTTHNRLASVAWNPWMFTKLA